MFIDIIAVILGIWAIYKGIRNGLVVGIFSFLSFIIGMAAAIKLSAFTADFIGRSTNLPQRWLPFLAFISVFILTALVVRVGAKVVEGAIKLAMLGWLNRLGGIALYLFVHLLVFSIILFYSEKLQLIKEETFQSSIVYAYIQPIAPWLMKMVGTILPLFKNMFFELEQFFSSINNRPT